MNRTGFLSAMIVALAFLSSCGTSESKKNETADVTTGEKRIVSLNGAITEIISDLGHEKELVARDMTSIYPESVKDNVKDLGHVRTLTIEPIVAEKPDLILASDQDMNPDLLGKIRESGIDYHVFDQEFSVDGTKKLIKQVAEEIGAENYQQLIEKIDADIAKVQPIENKPRVLFIYARGAGTLLVAGKNTPMAAMIDLAGGVNAAEQVEDFKPLTPEALVQSNPDIILMFDDGLQSLGGESGLMKIAGIEKTNAGKNKAFIEMNGAFLANFGPRVGAAAAELNRLMIESAK